MPSPTWPLLSLLSLLITLLIPSPTLAQNVTVTTTTTASPTLTRVVSLFFLNEREFEGSPYTLFHRDSGSIVAVDTVNRLTTYAVTTTRLDRGSATRAADNFTTAIPTLDAAAATRSSKHSRPVNSTGQPSTITQGPATFMYTGTRYGPDLTMLVLPHPFSLTPPPPPPSNNHTNPHQKE